MDSNAKVNLWGSTIGAISWLEDKGIGVFQYDPDFAESNIRLAPLMMPLSKSPYSFPVLSKETFKGLPGMLADSLPDKFGNAIIDAWLASEGRTKDSFNPVERLCYIGKRGMGALEFEPSLHDTSKDSSALEIDRLVDLANRVLNERSTLEGVFSGVDDHKVIEDILRVGTSAGGARAKAILVWNPTTNEFRSGQIDVDFGFEPWIMKFDGISNSAGGTFIDSSGYGKIEYAYHLMAIDAGIDMTECRLHYEGGRSHFMTRRFDRTINGEKLHMQSLGAMAHYDYLQPASYSYEQAIQVAKRLKLSQDDLNQLVLRAIFNVIGRNRDDHVKNIAFLMNKTGEWKLSPAYDMIYAWNPTGEWTSKHQMSVNSKRENIERSDLIAFADKANIKQRKANEMIDKVIVTFLKWGGFAEQAKINESRIMEIKRNLLIRL
ncbi:MAG: type II toxin-antitoxin system HipA family toxin [Candidatus Cloacimonetes bacterium]|nr:type II toxin-antitoxin system HipA family toxin [Candidatus Cloacimonadota bacterium]